MNPAGSKKVKRKEDKNFESANNRNNDNKRSKEIINNMIKSQRMCYTRKKKS